MIVEFFLLFGWPNVFAKIPPQGIVVIPVGPQSNAKDVNVQSNVQEKFGPQSNIQDVNIRSSVQEMFGPNSSFQQLQKSMSVIGDAVVPSGIKTPAVSPSAEEI